VTPTDLAKTIYWQRLLKTPLLIQQDKFTAFSTEIDESLPN